MQGHIYLMADISNSNNIRCNLLNIRCLAPPPANIGAICDNLLDANVILNKTKS